MRVLFRSNGVRVEVAQQFEGGTCLPRRFGESTDENGSDFRLRDVSDQAAEIRLVDCRVLIDEGRHHLGDLVRPCLEFSTGKEVGHLVLLGRSEEHTSELQSLMRISY